MNTAPMTGETLDAIEAREKAAEAGPWTVVFKPDERPTVCTAAHFRVARCESWAHDHANVVFIAAARTDVPALVADDRRLRAEVERLRAEIIAERAVSASLREQLATLAGKVLGRPSIASRVPCPTCHGDDPSDGPQAHQSCGTCGGAGTVPA